MGKCLLIILVFLLDVNTSAFARDCTPYIKAMFREGVSQVDTSKTMDDMLSMITPMTPYVCRAIHLTDNAVDNQINPDLSFWRWLAWLPTQQVTTTIDKKAYYASLKESLSNLDVSDKPILKELFDTHKLERSQRSFQEWMQFVDGEHFQKHFTPTAISLRLIKSKKADKESSHVLLGKFSPPQENATTDIEVPLLEAVERPHQKTLAFYPGGYITFTDNNVRHVIASPACYGKNHNDYLLEWEIYRDNRSAPEIWALMIRRNHDY